MKVLPTAAGVIATAFNMPGFTRAQVIDISKVFNIIWYNTETSL